MDAPRETRSIIVCLRPLCGQGKLTGLMQTQAAKLTREWRSNCPRPQLASQRGVFKLTPCHGESSFPRSIGHCAGLSLKYFPRRFHTLHSLVSGIFFSVRFATLLPKRQSACVLKPGTPPSQRDSSLDQLEKAVSIHSRDHNSDAGALGAWAEESWRGRSESSPL